MSNQDSVVHASFRATKAQMDALKAGAKDAGLCVSEYVRRKVFAGADDRRIGRGDFADLGIKIDEWGARILAELAAATRGDDPDTGRPVRAEPDERTLGTLVETLLLMRLSADSAAKGSAARKLRELGYPVFGLDARSGRVTGPHDAQDSTPLDHRGAMTTGLPGLTASR